MPYFQTALVVRAVHRARWLAELADALDQASRIALRLGAAKVDGARASEALALRARIDALHHDVDSLRRLRRFD